MSNLDAGVMEVMMTQTLFLNGAPGETDSSVGRQLYCLVAASQLRLSADFVGLGALVTPSGRLRRLSSRFTLLGSNSRPPGSKARIPKVVFLIISKLIGPPSTIVPPSAAENRQTPSKRYVFATQHRKVPGRYSIGIQYYSSNR